MPVFNEGVGSVGSAKARGTVSLEVDSKVTHKETVRCGKSSRCPNGVLPCSAEEYVHECRRVFCECNNLRTGASVWLYKRWVLS